MGLVACFHAEATLVLVNLNGQYDGDIPCYTVLYQLQKVLHIILRIYGFDDIHKELSAIVR